MRKELYLENRTRFLFAGVVLAALLVLGGCAYAVYNAMRAANDRVVEDALQKITYTETSAAAELASLQELEGRQPLSAETGGRLFRAMAEVSYMNGDDMLYNQYVAYAFYYLRRAGDDESAFYLTNKYIGRLYANGCYASAEEILTEFAENDGISRYPAELRASYYLSLADVRQMQGKDSADDLARARAALEAQPESGERSLNLAKLDILRARSFILSGDFAQAESVMAAYSETDNFGLGENQVYVVCDFQIPYEEIAAKLALNRQEYEVAYDYVDKYIAACDSYDFRTMKLHLLQYVVANTESGHFGSADAKKYDDMEKLVAQQNLDEMSGKYGDFLLTDIDYTTTTLAEQERMNKSIVRNALVMVAVLYVIFLLFCIISAFLRDVEKDGLTRLNNRKQYERMRLFCEQKKLSHCLLMFDIDNFKVVNDTFGHEKGDEVLRAIADILQSYTGRGITSYRYGGEELCMMLIRVPEPRAREIAEEVRCAVERGVSTAEMRVTVSGGVGVSVAGENVFLAADKQLYVAKRSGKNCVC